MKKMILALGFASMFFACGEDSLIQDVNDGKVAEDSKNLDSDDPEIADDSDSVKSSSSKNKSSSSKAKSDASEDVSTSSKTKSSSSKKSDDSSDEDDVVVKNSSSSKAKSSSSLTIVDVSSSSTVIAGPENSLGTCGPDENPIDKGGSTTWSFKPNASSISGYEPMQLATATYTWTFGDVDAVSLGGGVSAVSDDMRYSTSGKKNASVTVTMKDGSAAGTLDCTPLQVNGDPITCTCTGAGGDITRDMGVATWTASCVSGSEINGYTWNGKVSDSPTYTHTFVEKGESHKPTLSVSNVDNTVQTVTCSEVVATDASKPDYVIEIERDGSHRKIDSIPSGACVTVTGEWNNDGWLPDLRMTCEIKCNGECVMTMRNRTKSVTDASSWSLYLTIDLPPVSRGVYGPEEVCIEFTNYDVSYSNRDLNASTFARCGLIP